MGVSYMGLLSYYKSKEMFGLRNYCRVLMVGMEDSNGKGNCLDWVKNQRRIKMTKIDSILTSNQTPGWMNEAARHCLLKDPFQAANDE